MENKHYLDKFKKYDNALKLALNYQNEALTPAALQEERIRMVHDAKHDLRRDIPNPTKLIELAGIKANQALQKLTPNTADEVAITSNEWAKVESMLSEGNQLEAMVSKSDRNRLSAIYDRFLTSATASGLTEREEVKKEIDVRTLDRLAELGDTDALNSVEIRKEAERIAIWQKVIDETCESELSIQTRSKLYTIVGPEFEDTKGLASTEATINRQLNLISLQSN